MQIGSDQHSETIRLADGRSFVLRALRPDDLPALHRAFHRLTPEEVELRFLHQSRELPVFIETEVRELDPAQDAAFVLEDEAGEIRGVADLHVDPTDDGRAEFGLIVGQAVAGHGLGRRLLQRLLEDARRRGVALYGIVRRDNTRMLDLCRALGGTASVDADEPSLMQVCFQTH
ncbi:MAG TPA: GNAT family N-acetyltransferase [Rhodanobacteraceae bacterium]|nr:GNAT family N-acetyltransferase [Rhodanobacteraceae bacterium]